MYEAYKNADQRLTDLHHRIYGTGTHEYEFLIPTEENLNALDAELAALKTEIDALPEVDAPASIWKSHFQDFLADTMLSMENIHSKPANSIGMIMYSVLNIFRLDLRPDKVRVRKVEEITVRLKEILAALDERVDAFTPENKLGMVSMCKYNASQIDEMAERISVNFTTASFNEAEEEKLKNALFDIKKTFEDFAASEKWQASVSEEEVNDDELILKFEESYYRKVLHDNLGVELDDLLSWYEEEVVSTRAEVFAIANALDIPEEPKNMQDIMDILNKYAGPYDDTELMFKKGREYLDLAQEEARKVIYLPEDEYCRLREVPRTLKFSYPWGGYEGTDPHARPILGQFFLNEFNYTAVTDGWIKMMAIHEAYPGHHCQYVRCMINPIPETAKIGAHDIPLLEGTAHRSERLMEYIYPNDPFYPLFVSYRRHHTAVRIKADLMLRYFGRPMKEIVQLYMDELGFDRTTARGQIKAQESMEGYFTCYYYGMKKLEDWEKKYGIDSKTYTEYLFSVGRISVHNFERFLQLSEEDKQKFIKAFA